jgi:ABC-type sugar transport system permease subunit
MEMKMNSNQNQRQKQIDITSLEIENTFQVDSSLQSKSKIKQEKKINFKKQKELKQQRKRVNQSLNIKHIIFIFTLLLGFIISLLLGMILHFEYESNINISSILWTMSFLFFICSCFYICLSIKIYKIQKESVLNDYCEDNINENSYNSRKIRYLNMFPL